jgi:hypothetical protein
MSSHRTKQLIPASSPPISPPISRSVEIHRNRIPSRSEGEQRILQNNSQVLLPGDFFSEISLKLIFFYLEIPFNDLWLNNEEGIIGKGQHGYVFRGLWRGSQVAIRFPPTSNHLKINPNDVNSNQDDDEELCRKKFIKECNLR